MTLWKDARADCILWLVCAAAIAGVGFWYPEGVMNRNAAPDDRSGAVLIMAMPFYLLGAAMAIRSLRRLIALTRSPDSPANRRFVFAGALLTVFSLTPLLVILFRIGFVR